MDLQYKMVLEPTCSVEGGVLFWKGRLTYKQAQSLRGDGFVKAVITIVADVPQKVIPGARMKRSKLQAKDQKTYNSAELETHIPHLKSSRNHHCHLVRTQPGGLERLHRLLPCKTRPRHTHHQRRNY